MDDVGMSTTDIVDALSGYPEYIRFLHGLEIDLSDVCSIRCWGALIQHAVQNGHCEVISLLHECGVKLSQVNGTEQSAFIHTAVSNGHADCIRMLHSLGVTVSGEDCSSYIEIAAGLGHEGCIRALLECGAAVDLFHSMHLNAVHYAAAAGYTDCISTLLEYGADLSSPDDMEGWTALHWAAINGQLNSLKCLHAHMADLNIVGMHIPTTAVHCAATNNHCDCLRFLLSAGADVEILLSNPPSDTDPEVRSVLECLSLRVAQLPGSASEQKKLYSFIQLAATCFTPDIDEFPTLPAFKTKLTNHLLASPRVRTMCIGLQHAVGYVSSRRLMDLVITVLVRLRRGCPNITSEYCSFDAMFDLLVDINTLTHLVALRFVCRACALERRFPLPGTKLTKLYGVLTIETGLVEEFVGGKIAHFVPNGALTSALRLHMPDQS
jgi:hypothetical protein